MFRLNNYTIFNPVDLPWCPVCPHRAVIVLYSLQNLPITELLFAIYMWRGSLITFWSHIWTDLFGGKWNIAFSFFSLIQILSKFQSTAHYEELSAGYESLTFTLMPQYDRPELTRPSAIRLTISTQLYLMPVNRSESNSTGSDKSPHKIKTFS